MNERDQDNYYLVSLESQRICRAAPIPGYPNVPTLPTSPTMSAPIVYWLPAEQSNDSITGGGLLHEDRQEPVPVHPWKVTASALLSTHAIEAHRRQMLPHFNNL